VLLNAIYQQYWGIYVEYVIMWLNNIFSQECGFLMQKAEEVKCKRNSLYFIGLRFEFCHL